MAVRYVYLTDIDKLDCTIEFIKSIPDVDSWDRNAGISAGYGIRNSSYAYLIITDGHLSTSLLCPKDSVELVPEYVRAKWAVVSYTLKDRETIAVAGKQYYRDDVLELLEGKEIQ